jgi:hypothetical protein
MSRPPPCGGPADGRQPFLPSLLVFFIRPLFRCRKLMNGRRRNGLVQQCVGLIVQTVGFKKQRLLRLIESRLAACCIADSSMAIVLLSLWKHKKVSWVS